MLFPNGKKFRQPVIITRTKVPNTDQVNFPVLFSITARDLAHVSYGGGVENVNGWDIIFASDPLGLNKLDHEIESYDKTTGTFIAWVRLPKVYTSIDTLFYIFYGGKVIASQENITGVWDSNYKGVWHLPNGSTLTSLDSTNNANNSSSQGMTVTTGKIGGGANGNGSQDIVIPSSSSLNVTNPITVQGWVISTTITTNNQPIISKGTGSQFRYLLATGNSGKFVLQLLTSSTSYVLFLSSNTTLSSNTWYHIVATYDGTNGYIYINGAQDGTATGSGTNDGGGANDVKIASASGLYLSGALDEVRLSSIARSADWISTEYNNQNSPSTFLSLDKRWTMRRGIVVPRLFGAAAGGTAYTKTLTDSSTLTDTLIKAISKTLTEAQSYADTILKAISKTLSENQSYSDTLTKIKVILKTLTETVTHTDTLVRAMSKTLTEAQSYVDSVIKAITRTFTENQSYSDTLTKLKVVLKTLTESFTSTDTLSRAMGKVLTEAQSITDTVIKAVSKTFTESSSVLDFLTKIYTPVGSGINNIKNYILKRVFKTSYTVKDTKKTHTIKLGK